jgi:hypothetical protein
MCTIDEIDGTGKLPMDAFRAKLRAFIAPMLPFLPEKRLRAIPALAIQGILAGRSPLITRIAAGVAHPQGTSWPLAKRLYRFLWNKRFSHRHLLKGLYALAQQVVAAERPTYLLIALDPVNFEKPYTRALEGVSTVMKATPPRRDGGKRLTPGYPAITATVVNLATPVITYAHWFSYQSETFISQSREVYRALRTTRALFPGEHLCFLGDAGLDDQALFSQMQRFKASFIIRACHNRLIQVYARERHLWETHLLQDYATSLPAQATARVLFRHARRWRITEVSLAWFAFRLPETKQRLHAIVAYDPDEDRYLILLTNLALRDAKAALAAYRAWRFRPQIEHIYRFDQEDGLHIEDISVHTLERMRRVFILVLLAALFVYDLAHTGEPALVLWLRHLGGKLGRKSDCDGPYILLAGIAMFLNTVATLCFAQHSPLPAGLTCG